MWIPWKKETWKYSMLIDLAYHMMSSTRNGSMCTPESSERPTLDFQHELKRLRKSKKSVLTRYKHKRKRMTKRQVSG